MNDPLINGNILTVYGASALNMTTFALQNSITTFSVRPEGNGFQISFPITKEVESNIPGILHGARARLKAAEAESNDDNTPPPMRA